jgi:hypothetical protein
MERDAIPYESELRAELKRLMQESDELLRRKLEISSRMADILDALAKPRMNHSPEDPQI